MKGALRRFVLAVLSVVIVVSCDNLGPQSQRSEGQFDRVFIVCSLGYNNLSNSLAVNIDSLSKGAVPTKDSRDAIVVYSHSTSSPGDYHTPTMPVVYRLYKEDGKVVKEPIGYFPSGTVGGDLEAFGDALNHIREKMPSKSYSMLLSSHATGWLPPRYNEPGISLFSVGKDSEKWPLTKSVGAHFAGSMSNTVEMELSAFAKAIPMKLDYLIFDACLMGCVEVAYELKDVCDYLIVSPTEILSKGFVYAPMAGRLLSGPKPDLKGVCQDYFNYYLSQSGTSRSATVTLVDCSGLERVADVFSGIVEAHGESIATIRRNRVQGYFYDSKHWFYDLRDFAANFGATSSELSQLDEALNSCVIYKAATDTFFSLKLERVCGLSVYIPDSEWDELNGYYRSLSWNSATCLVK